jgi:hypothetical protein
MAHPGGTLFFKETSHEIFVAHVTNANTETLLVGTEGAQEIQVALLDLDIVIVIELVHNHDLVATFQEELGHVAANETRAARHEHRLVLGMRLDNIRAWLGDFDRIVVRRTRAETAGLTRFGRIVIFLQGGQGGKTGAGLHVVVVRQKLVVVVGCRYLLRRRTDI